MKDRSFLSFLFYCVTTSYPRDNGYTGPPNDRKSHPVIYIGRTDLVLCIRWVAHCTSFLSRQRDVIASFLCQLTCQSADIMSSLCGVGVRVRVRVNNFFSKTTRPRDMLFFLKDTLSIEDEKLFKACKSVFLLRYNSLPCGT